MMTSSLISMSLTTQRFDQAACAEALENSPSDPQSQFALPVSVQETSVKRFFTILVQSLGTWPA